MTGEMRYVDENGFPLPRWNPRDPDKRGRHKTFASAVDAATQDILVERDPFFESLTDRWRSLFPASAARPGRYDSGKIVLYVRSAPALFAFRPRLAQVKKALAALPGAPSKIDLRLEIHP